LSRPRGIRSGIAAVEFAAVAIMLGILVAGMVELGRAAMVKSILTDAARKGAATGATQLKTYTDIYNDVDDILNKDHELPATLANGEATIVVTVAKWDPVGNKYGSDTAMTSSTFSASQYDKVTVKVSVHASDVTWSFLNYLSGDIESESVVMMRQ
jgi:Flp pilus assembly protein TadG